MHSREKKILNQKQVILNNDKIKSLYEELMASKFSLEVISSVDWTVLDFSLSQLAKVSRSCMELRVISPILLDTSNRYSAEIVREFVNLHREIMTFSDELLVCLFFYRNFLYRQQKNMNKVDMINLRIAYLCSSDIKSTPLFI